MRSYEDAVQVQAVQVKEAPSGGVATRVRPGEPDAPVAPTAFLWRGRLYVVRDVLAHWYERRAWWSEGAARAVRGESPAGDGDGLGGDREIWRVEASAGRQAGTGVYDLCRNASGPEGWTLLRVVD
ncbi:DUF6504 family protein [Thalassiella azotivora]